MSRLSTVRCPRALADVNFGMMLAITVLVLLTAPAHVRAQPDVPPEAAPRIVGIRPGFGGKFKVGYWTPIGVELEGGSKPTNARLELIVPDGDGVPSRVPAINGQAILLAAGEKKIVAAYAKLGQFGAGITVNLRDDESLLATRTFEPGLSGSLAGVLPSNQPLAVALGSAVDSADERALAQRGLRLARVAQVELLPEEWWGYEGVDTFVLSAADAESAGQWVGADSRVAALQLWVRMGGQLILNVGDQAPSLLAAGRPLAAFAPGTFESLVPLRQTNFIETYAETSDTLDVPGALSIARLSPVRDKIEAFAGAGARDLPLVVRSADGFGQVVYVAFDLASPPLKQWTGRPQLLGKLLGRTAATSSAASENSGLGEVTTLGFVDLSGQLRGALDQFPGVWNVPFWLVAVLVSAYVVCIGPLDYVLVKRIFKRMEATWLTFAVTVLLFCAGGVALAFALKGHEVRLNQVDLVDFDAESKLFRGTSWFTLYSPRIEAYDLAPKVSALGIDAAQSSASPRTLFSWSGLSGEGFGGMDSGSRAMSGIDSSWRGTALFTEPYDFSPQFDRLTGVPIAVWSSKAFVARCWQTSESPLNADLKVDDRLLGTLKNNLPAALSHVVLVYDKWAYVIRDLPAGGSLNLDDIDPQTVETYLRHVRAQRDQQISTPYDPSSFDVPRIVEIMTAHSLTGGEKYTGLANQYQAFTELSRSIRDGRAVLFGRAERPAMQLKQAGQAVEAQRQGWTFYRFVFPVRPAAGAGNN